MKKVSSGFVWMPALTAIVALVICILLHKSFRTWIEFIGSYLIVWIGLAIIDGSWKKKNG